MLTGVGVVAPNGIGKDAFWDALKHGKSGIKRISSFDPEPFPTRVAGEILDFSPASFLDPKKVRRMDRFVQFGAVAARMAVQDAGLLLEKEDPDRVGVIAGTATAGQGWVFTQYEIFREKGYKKLNPFTSASTFPNALSAHISLDLGVNGPSDTFSTGCASGSIAIGYALELIRNNKIDIAVVVGSEALLYAPIFASYAIAGVMSTRNENTPSPFDKDRDGIVLAEGSGCVVLESLDHARERGASAYVELAGWGETCDAYHIISQRPDGAQAARAIAMAITDAQIDKDSIDYIKMHGAGDIFNDKIETQTVKDVFGKRSFDIPCSSIKSMIGHTQGASGVIEAVAVALAIKNGVVPPTINYHTEDPDCDLDYVPNKARPRAIKHSLLNTFGFGGKNVAIILKECRGI